MFYMKLLACIWSEVNKQNYECILEFNLKDFKMIRDVDENFARQRSRQIFINERCWRYYLLLFLRLMFSVPHHMY